MSNPVHSVLWQLSSRWMWYSLLQISLKAAFSSFQQCVHRSLPSWMRRSWLSEIVFAWPIRRQSRMDRVFRHLVIVFLIVWWVIIILSGSGVSWSPSVSFCHRFGSTGKWYFCLWKSLKDIIISFNRTFYWNAWGYCLLEWSYVSLSTTRSTQSVRIPQISIQPIIVHVIDEILMNFL